MKNYKQPLSILITFFFLYLIINELNWDLFKESILSINILYILAALSLVGLSFIVRMYRWNLMLNAQGRLISLRESSWPFIVGAGLNAVMPLRIGDVVRVVAFKDQLKSSSSEIMAVILIERVFDMFALLVIFHIGLSNISHTKLSSAYFLSANLLLFVTVILFLALILFQHRFRSFILRVVDTKIAVLLTKKIKKENIFLGIDSFFNTIDKLRATGLLMKVISLSFLTWFIEGGMFYVIGLGLALTMGDFGVGAWFSFALGSLSTVLPSAPGFIGTLDYFVIIGITAYGASWDGAASFAVIAHIIMIAPLALVAIIYMSMNKKIKKVPGS